MKQTAEEAWSEFLKEHPHLLPNEHVFKDMFIHSFNLGARTQSGLVPKKPGVWIQITLDDGRVFHLPKECVAKNRANYYKENKSGYFIEEYDYIMSHNKDADDEAIDWLLNNMDWYEEKPLLVEDNRTELRDCAVYSVCVVAVPC